jgi:hypothetical protein
MDHAGVQWEYEPEGFSLPSGQYLPDFWLPKEQIWMEIKPLTCDDVDLSLCDELADLSGKSCVMICGSPYLVPFDGVDGYLSPEFFTRTFHGWRLPDSNVFEHDAWWFGMKFLEENTALSLHSFLASHGYFVPGPPVTTRQDILTTVGADREYFYKRFGKEHPTWKYGLSVNNNNFPSVKNNRLCFVGDPGYRLDDPVVSYLRAGSAARFEFGKRH